MIIIGLVFLLIIIYPLAVWCLTGAMDNLESIGYRLLYFLLFALLATFEFLNFFYITKHIGEIL